MNTDTIENNSLLFNRALIEAHNNFPRKDSYPVSSSKCIHPYGKRFCIFCDGGDWDIVRCLDCGEEFIQKCTFDDDFD